MCDVCEHMYMHIHVCDQWTVTQLHVLFEGEVIGMHNNDGIRWWYMYVRDFHSRFQKYPTIMNES